MFALVSTDDDEADALFAARRLAYPALERLGPVLTEDVCVPRSALPAMLGQLEEIAATPRRDDGDHRARRRRQPAPAADRPARRRRGPPAAQAAFEEMLDAAIALGGTVTGEHGVGLLKRDGMLRELDPLAMRCSAASSRPSTRSGSSTPARSSGPTPTTRSVAARLPRGVRPPPAPRPRRRWLKRPGSHRIGQVVELVGPTMGAVTTRIPQHPRRSDLRHRHAAGLGDPLDGVDDGLVLVAGVALAHGFSSN